ncbi:MAG: hypothetical protein R3261_04435 [Alphaproteobacteria bacterium]|nr:hypothetical protein [Alphaproteobacteria bacterium]
MLSSALISSLDQVEEILIAVQDLPDQEKTNLYIYDGVGRHIRHILDHVQALLQARQSGHLDYNARNRSHLMEVDAANAYSILKNIHKDCDHKWDIGMALTVVSEIDTKETRNHAFQSNMAREILYVINHTLHHTAYIKLLARGRGVCLADVIGIAPATASYMRKSA